MRAVNARLGYEPLPDELHDARTAVRRHHGRGDRDATETDKPSASTRLPPDPERTTPHAHRARAKGLPGPYIAGGEDPDPAAGLADDRRYGRLLLGWSSRSWPRGSSSGPLIALVGPAGGRDAPSPSRALGVDPGDDLGGAHDALLATLRDLIRIPSINPPPTCGARRRDAGRPIPRRPADRARPASRRSSNPSPAAARSTPGCTATARVASRSSCCRTSMSCPAARTAGATIRSRPTSPTGTSTVAARST